MNGPFNFEIMPFGEFGALFEFEERSGESNAYPDISCVTPGNPYVLHCFPPFKTDLTSEQHRHLDIIADKIRSSFSTLAPITKVVILGHSSTWHTEMPDQLRLRSIQRAGTAGEQLILRLDRMGLAKKVHIETDGRSDSSRWQGRPYSSTSGSQSAQNDRALNRRVEVHLIGSKKKPDPEPPASCELGDALKKIDLRGMSRQVRLDYLRKLLIAGVCHNAIDDRFWTFSGSDALGRKTVCVISRQPAAHEGTTFIRIKPYRYHNLPAVFLDRNEKPIRIVELFKKQVGMSRDPKAIRSILIWLEQAMNCNLEMLGQYIELSCDVGPSGFAKDPICEFVHDAYKKATSGKLPSVYGCFRNILKEYSTTCRKGCNR